jgi:hypothetical protein
MALDQTRACRNSGWVVATRAAQSSSVVTIQRFEPYRGDNGIGHLTIFVLKRSAQGLEECARRVEHCLAIFPCDTQSKRFLARIAQFGVTAPCAEWNGVWPPVDLLLMANNASWLQCLCRSISNDRFGRLCTVLKRDQSAVSSSAASASKVAS